MSRRTDKKRQKRLNDVQPSVAASTPTVEPVTETKTVPAAETVVTPAAATAPAYDLYIQYQSREYDTEVLADKILEKCKAEGMDSSELKIYVKPEDKKAYYACAGGTGAIDLA